MNDGVAPPRLVGGVTKVLVATTAGPRAVDGRGGVDMKRGIDDGDGKRDGVFGEVATGAAGLS